MLYMCHFFYSKDKETQLAALDRHRHLSTIGSKLTAENRSNPTVTLTMLKDFSLNGQGADSIVVIGGEQELLLQYGHDMRREHQITVQDAQQRVCASCLIWLSKIVFAQVSGCNNELLSLMNLKVSWREKEGSKCYFLYILDCNACEYNENY